MWPTQQLTWPSFKERTDRCNVAEPEEGGLRDLLPEVVDLKHCAKTKEGLISRSPCRAGFKPRLPRLESPGTHTRKLAMMYITPNAKVMFNSRRLFCRSRGEARSV